MSIQNTINTSYQLIQEGQDARNQTMQQILNAKHGNFGPAAQSGSGSSVQSQNGVASTSSSNPVGDDSGNSVDDNTAEACGLLAYLAMLSQSSDQADATAQIASTIAQLQALMTGPNAITDPTILADVKGALTYWNGTSFNESNYISQFWQNSNQTPGKGLTNPYEDAFNWLSKNNYQIGSTQITFAVSMLFLAAPLVNLTGIGTQQDLDNLLTSGDGDMEYYLENFLYSYADANGIPLKLIADTLVPPAKGSTDAYATFYAKMQNDYSTYTPTNPFTNQPFTIPSADFTNYITGLASYLNLYL